MTNPRTSECCCKPLPHRASSEYERWARKGYPVHDSTPDELLRNQVDTWVNNAVGCAVAGDLGGVQKAKENILTLVQTPEPREARDPLEEATETVIRRMVAYGYVEEGTEEYKDLWTALYNSVWPLTELPVDDPESDATDFAHPAWGRGNDMSDPGNYLCGCELVEDTQPSVMICWQFALHCPEHGDGVDWNSLIIGTVSRPHNRWVVTYE